MDGGPSYPRCYATIFFNDTSGGTAARRSFVLDIAMARLWVTRMLNLTSLPIFVLFNRENDVGSVLAPWLSSEQLVLRQVLPVIVNPKGTHSWYRLTHTKFQAWGLHRQCGQVALLDYDGIPLQRMDPYIFDACGSAALCGVVDWVTPVNQKVRQHYMNTGCLVLRPSPAYHEYLLREAALDAGRKNARYFAEQGFFRERRIPWKRLAGGFNVQAGLLKRRWSLNTLPPVDVNTSDFFLHKKFFEVPGPVQKRLGLRDCSGPPSLATGRCYMSLQASSARAKRVGGQTSKS